MQSPMSAAARHQPREYTGRRHLLGSHPEPDLATISARQGLRRSQAGHRKRQQARPMQVGVHVSGGAFAAAGVGALGPQGLDQECCQRGVTACVEGVRLHLHASDGAESSMLRLPVGSSLRQLPACMECRSSGMQPGGLPSTACGAEGRMQQPLNLHPV